MEKSKPRVLSGVEVSFIGKYTGKESYTCYEIEAELDNGLHERIWVPKEFVAYDHGGITADEYMKKFDSVVDCFKQPTKESVK